MSPRGTLLIVGAGLAGVKAAEGARTNGFNGRIVLVGDEPRRPYERPPLSKSVLRGEAEPSSAEVHDPDFYSRLGIAVRLGQRVTALDTSRRRARLGGSGETIAFDTAVLTTGARPRALTVPGHDLAGVHYLRTLDEAVALRAAIRTAERVAVIGAGWIGAEVAASARQMGASVVLVDPLEVPLQRVLGRRMGEVFRQLHLDHGVELRMGCGVRALGGTDRVREVFLTDGRTEAADVVVVGIGAEPRTDLAATAGLAVDDGVLVDSYLATSAPGLYAAGDIANASHPVLDRRLRVEHWDNALNQGLTAGANATGAQQIYDRMPFFFSDQFDLGMEYRGHGAPDDDVVIRGDLGTREFIAFWLRDMKVTATMNVNVWDVAEQLDALITSGDRVEPTRLTDPDVPLADLAPQAQGLGTT